MMNYSHVIAHSKARLELIPNILIIFEKSLNFGYSEKIVIRTTKMAILLEKI